MNLSHLSFPESFWGGLTPNQRLAVECYKTALHEIAQNPSGAIECALDGLREAYICATGYDAEYTEIEARYDIGDWSLVNEK